MNVAGETAQVLLRGYQMHPFRPMILHADFQRVDANKKIHMNVPLHFVNAEISPGVKIAGGLAQHVLNELEIRCLPKDLPEFITVDLRMRFHSLTFRACSCPRAWKPSWRRARTRRSPPS
jgi:large subunit ribosomal protein L25